MNIPANVEASNHGFPFHSREGQGWMRARHLYPLADAAGRAAIEDQCSRYQHYTGEASDLLTGIWSRLGWPIPAESLTPAAK
jgi:hypothetical protein